MNYKKLISSRFSSMPSCSTTDTSGAFLALVAGLAVGAVLGILFAPDSGKKTREKISDKALNAADNVKDGLYAMKDRVATGKDSLVKIKDQVIDGIKNKANSVSQDFQDFKDEEINKVKSDIKAVADDANDSIQQA